MSLARHLRLWSGARCKMGSMLPPEATQYHSMKPPPESYHVDPALMAHRDDGLVSESPVIPGTRVGSTEAERDSFNQVSWSASQGLRRHRTCEASLRLPMSIGRHQNKFPDGEPLDVGYLGSVSEWKDDPGRHGRKRGSRMEVL